MSNRYLIVSNYRRYSVDLLITSCIPWYLWLPVMPNRPIFSPYLHRETAFSKYVPKNVINNGINATRAALICMKVRNIRCCLVLNFPSSEGDVNHDCMVCVGWQKGRQQGSSSNRSVFMCAKHMKDRAECLNTALCAQNK